MNGVSLFGMVSLSLALTACVPLVSMGSPATTGPPTVTAPLRPVAAHRTTTLAVNVPAEFEVVQMIISLAPGTFSVVQTHGGSSYLTVLEGEITLRPVTGAEQKVKAGDSALQAPGEFAQVGNTGTVTAQYVSSILLPKGGTITTQQDPTAPQPAGLTTSAHTFAVPQPTASFDVVQFTLTFAPGAMTPLHTHGGQANVTVLDGAITFASNGVTMTHPAGESFTEGVNEVGQAMNIGNTPAKVVAVFLLPKGAVLTTNQ